MKAAIYRQAGGPEVFEYVEVADPVPGDADIVIRVAAISVESGDLLTRRFVAPPSPMHVPGYAAAGEIVAIGAAVTGFHLGQTVATFGFGGAYAELRCVPAATCWAVPPGLGPVRAAAAVVGVGTALDALGLGDFTPADTVLVTGAAGIVGLAAMQIARNAGARVLGTSTSAASLDILKSYGMSDAVLLGEKPLADHVRQVLDGGEADLLIDTVGGAMLADALTGLRTGGRAVLVGANGGGTNNLDSTAILLRRLRVTGCFLGPIMGEPEQRRIVAQAIAMVAEGSVRIPVDRTFSLSEAAAAHTRAEQRGRIGRVIMIPDSIGG